MWIWAGTSKKTKYIPLRDVHSSFNCDESNTLLPFHALTGCDSTSFICGHSKKTAWKVFLDNFELLFPIVKDVLNDAAITSAELFFCRLYKTSETSLDMARVALFGKVGSPEKLPPTSDAFRQHLLRCHYQTAVWRQAHVPKPTLPNPTETGWMLQDDQLTPVFMTLEPIPKACLEMVSCKCTTGCATLRCSCRKSNVVCSGLCECTNTEKHYCINRP